MHHAQAATSYPTPVSIYDTLAANKRRLTTLAPGSCRIYCCGPTVYDLSHLGHARAALAPDLLVRTLRAHGVEVVYARNVTDVDDKIIARAAERAVEPGALADEYTVAYREDMRRLNMLDPSIEPRVTEHIQEIIALVERLIARGLGYVVEGDVYFAVDAFPGYGALSKRRLEDLRAGARVEVDPRKQSPLDFALWKAAKPGEPAWASPWGPGRPGWHIECSAMSTCHLGQDFDVHAGGRDLIFPHHENEIAQSQGAFGPGSYARFWLHNGFVNFAGEKMSKSLGNFFTVREVLELYHPEVLRWALLAVHYRSPINFEVQVSCSSCGAELDQAAQAAEACPACGQRLPSDELRRRVRFPLLEEADERLAYVYETLRGARALVAEGPELTAAAQPDLEPALVGLAERVRDALSDDLNSAVALSELSEPLALANRLIQSGKGTSRERRLACLAAFLREFEAVGAMLGLFEREPSELLAERRALKARRLGLDEARVEALVRERWQARAARDFAAADRLRAELAALGVEVRDGPAGSTWSL